MSIVAALRDRAVLLRVEASEIDRRIVAIQCADYRDPRVPVVTRLRAFLGAFAPMAFSPRELMEAIAAEESSTRKALWRLNREGLVEHVSHGLWTVRR